MRGTVRLSDKMSRRCGCDQVVPRWFGRSRVAGEDGISYEMSVYHDKLYRPGHIVGTERPEYLQAGQSNLLIRVEVYCNGQTEVCTGA